MLFFFFFQAEDGIRDVAVTGVQTCALPICQLWIGTDGKLVAGTYGDDPKVLDPAKQADIVAHPPAQKYARSPGVYPEWIAACKGGTPAGPTFDGDAGGLTSMEIGRASGRGRE